MTLHIHRSLCVLSILIVTAGADRIIKTLRHNARDGVGSKKRIIQETLTSEGISKNLHLVSDFERGRNQYDKKAQEPLGLVEINNFNPNEGFNNFHDYGMQVLYQGDSYGSSSSSSSSIVSQDGLELRRKLQVVALVVGFVFLVSFVMYTIAKLSNAPTILTGSPTKAPAVPTISPAPTITAAPSDTPPEDSVLSDALGLFRDFLTFFAAGSFIFVILFVGAILMWAGACAIFWFTAWFFV